MKKIILCLFLIGIVLALMPSCAVYETDTAYVPVQTVPDYYTMRAYDDRYVFYSGVEPVAVWRFGEDGVVYKEGIVINGPVRVYSEPGVLFAETYYSGGIRDGYSRYYYPNGGVMYSGYYSHGYIAGSWSSYNTSGVVAASYQFHGTETNMPSNFQPPENQNGRIGFQAMQKETAYAGTQPVVAQSFNKAQAVPAKYSHSFGAMPPAQQGTGTVGAGALKQQGMTGQVQQQGTAGNQKPGVPGNVAAPNQQGMAQGRQIGANQKPVQAAGVNPANQQGMAQGQQPAQAAAAPNQQNKNVNQANNVKNQNNNGAKFNKNNKKQKPAPAKPAKKKKGKKNNKMF